MNRVAQNCLLIMLGGALLKLAFTGAYLRYVKPGQLWLLIIAGVVMVALAVFALGRDLRGYLRAAATSGGPHDDHHHGGRSAWLLLLPVLAVLLIAPPALGADSVERAGDTAPRGAGRAAADTPVFAPLPKHDPVRLTLSEFVRRAAWDDQRSLAGRKVLLTGFVVREKGEVYVARIAIFCCAADSAPMKVKLVGADLSRFPVDQWIETVVELLPGQAEEGSFVPTATVADVKPVPEPENPYE